MKRLTIATVLVLLVVVGLVGWHLLKPNDEPVYQGRTLTSWIEGAYEGSVSFEVSDWVVRQAGTNALPTLLRLLRAKDVAWKDNFTGLLRRCHLIKVEPTPANRFVVAQYAFEVLGTNAQTAVPELIAIANQNLSRSSRLAAIYALSCVGPPARQAVPRLLQWATNADTDISFYAEDALRRIDPEAAAQAGKTGAP